MLLDNHFLKNSHKKCCLSFGRKLKESEIMKKKNKFTLREIELLEKENIDIEKEYDFNSLEEIEDIIYNKMMDNLDKDQNFTPLAEEYENILNIIVECENQ